MGIEQDWKGLAGSWPGSASLFSVNTLNQLGQPLTPIENTLGSIGYALPDPTPWTQVNYFWDPLRKDPRSQQWNVEIQRQIGSDMAASIGYVGSYSDRLDLTGLWNTAVTPGPGTPDQVNARRPFPWIPNDPKFGTSGANANFNALEAKFERRFAGGFQYLISYTWSKSIDTASSGWFSVENSSSSRSDYQDYYHPNASRSVSSYDIPQFLSISGIWELPFGRGRRYLTKGGPINWIIGNWQANGVVQLRSGAPYNLAVIGDVANVGDTSGRNFVRPNLIGDPRLSDPTSEEWFNVSAFSVPSYSYGNFGRNVLRSASVYDADLSFTKSIPIRENWSLQFRSELFNIFNIQNYDAPGTLIGDPGAGRVTDTVTRPRQIQFGLRLAF
jgi:hypothetical protein